jgi:hypothetical protein
MDWIYVTQHRGHWRAVVKTEGTFGFHSGKFLDSGIVSFSRRTQLHGGSVQSSEIAPGHIQAHVISFATSGLFPAVQLPCAKVNRFLAQMSYDFKLYCFLT